MRSRTKARYKESEDEMVRIQQMHECGVHTLCYFPTAKTGGAVGIRPAYHDGGHSGWCIKAGQVEKWHSHDFEGPLWQACGCEELSYA